MTCRLTCDETNEPRNPITNNDNDMRTDNNLHLVIDIVWPYKRRLIAAGILTVLLTLAAMCPPLLLALIVDRIIGQQQWQLIGLVAMGWFSLVLIQAIISFGNSYLISWVAHRMVLDVRNLLYRHLHGLSAGFFHRTPTGKIMERLMTDVGRIQMLVTGQTISVLTDVVAATVAIAAVFWLNWRMALVVLGFLPLYLINYRFFVKRIRQFNETSYRQWDDISGRLRERIGGMNVVKAFGQEQAEAGQFIRDNQRALQLVSKAWNFSVSYSSIATLINGLGSMVILFLGCYLVILGEMAYGAVLAFCAYAMQLLGPAVRFSGLANTIEQTMISVDRVREFLCEHADIQDSPAAFPAKRLAGNVTFEHVDFEYEPGNPVLTDFSLDVPAGAMIALVGHTGCGKSTIVNLLFRFYDPRKGRILMDGTDLRDFEVASLRRQIGLVPQESFIFEDTVAANIAYGRPRADRGAIIEAARIAELHGPIRKMPDGYDTRLGTEGVQMSVGQQQRLAIARAVLTDPAILVLDEATSSLDSEAEQLIQKALTNVMADRTSLVIAHRLSTIVHADVIVVMDQGRILESGDHERLMASPVGTYRGLYQTQFKKIQKLEEAA